MTTPLQNRWRSLFAILCLCGIVLLYAPLGGAAWSLYSNRCCTTSQCPIHGHHQPNSPASRSPMDCGHDMPGMSTCSMSCCHNPDRRALTPVIFVLSTPLKISVAVRFEPLASLSTLRNPVPSIEPLSPPPRISAAAA